MGDTIFKIFPLNIAENIVYYNRTWNRLEQRMIQVSIHSDAINKIYKLAKKFKGLVPSGISQIGEIPNPKKKVVRHG